MTMTQILIFSALMQYGAHTQSPSIWFNENLFRIVDSFHEFLRRRKTLHVNEVARRHALVLFCIIIPLPLSSFWRWFMHFRNRLHGNMYIRHQIGRTNLLLCLLTMNVIVTVAGHCNDNLARHTIFENLMVVNYQLFLRLCTGDRTRTRWDNLGERIIFHFLATWACKYNWWLTKMFNI